MRQKSATSALAFLLVVAGTPRLAIAQQLDQLGTRAAALSAFVAVSDDASAVAWNPAGLVNGPIFNILLNLDSFRRTESDRVDVPAAERGTTFLAAAMPPVGLSYSRGRQTVVSPAVGTPPGREDRQLLVRSLLTNELGVTVLHSLADQLTIGTTVKLVHGELASGMMRAGSVGEAFDAAETLQGHGRTTADVDAGALASTGRMRFGIVARHLVAPRFDDGRADGETMQLTRHVRIGAAWADSWPGMSKLVLSADADMTRVPYPEGERRDIAAGVERWFRGQSFAARGGVRASTTGAARPIASAGASVALRSGTYVEVFLAAGNKDRRWGIAGRLMY